MRRIALLLGVVLASACEPAATTTPDDGTDKLERIDVTESPSTADAAGDAKAAGPVDKKAVPKVRDRDPEEEKKKLALSHQRSAEAEKMLAGGRYTEALDHSRQALKI
ncbi:MAG TPA: hypothetical protein VG755_39915, partial [Nannocystaceae bacterium]|nr:hypothetical protein [Nannocystaceae bacterium]